MLSRWELRLVLALCTAGCTQEEANIQRGIATHPTTAQLEIVEELHLTPAGGDGPSWFRVVLNHGAHKLPIKEWVIGGAPWQGGALVLRPSGRLEWVMDDGTTELIDEGVLIPPTLSHDNRFSAWATEEGGEVVLVVHDGKRKRSFRGHQLISVGSIVWEKREAAKRRLAFIGAKNGGVAGLWALWSDGEGMSCLTNCTLKVGDPLDQGYSPLPDRILGFEADALVVEVSDQEVRISLPKELR
ncbi:MAG: hypothetical protein NZM37_02450 [Sandaracinaceae bacterium]|nr:hypothetical protein [Sandaracinaceae bacterium]